MLLLFCSNINFMSDITYTCTACNQEFSDESSLKNHMVQDHTTKTETVVEGEAK